MKKNRKVVIALLTASALACVPCSGVRAAEESVGELLDRFRTENVANSGVLVDVSAVGDQVLGVVCQPSGILKQAEGSFLVTDLYHKVIWRVNGASSEIYAGLAGPRDLSGEPMGGYRDGAADQAMFQEPWAVVPFMNGYAVSDPANHVVRYIENGKVRTVAGNHTPGMADGSATTLSVMLNHPTGLAADDKGNLFIADTNNNAIRRLDSTGKVITCAVQLNEPTGLFWKDGALYIADSGNGRICRLTGLYENGGTEGKLTVVAGAGSGPERGETFRDGAAAEAEFMNPQGVAVGADGAVYVADTGNGAIRKIMDGQVSTLLKLDSRSMGTCPVSPRGLALDQNTLYITDPFSYTLLKLPLQ